MCIEEDLLEKIASFLLEKQLLNKTFGTSNNDHPVGWRLIQQKSTGVPKNLRVDTFQTPLAILGTLVAILDLQDVQGWISERVPPAPQGWY